MLACQDYAPQPAGRVPAQSVLGFRNVAPECPVSLQKGRRAALTVVSVTLCGAALSQTAFFWGHNPASSGPGWRLLLQGWRGVPRGYVEWLANPALLISWGACLYGRRFLAMTSACGAVVLMLVFLCRRNLEIPISAAGMTVVAYGAGYWLWLGSALVMVVATARSASR
jgi:hypothetical protein